MSWRERREANLRALIAADPAAISAPAPKPEISGAKRSVEGGLLSRYTRALQPHAAAELRAELARLAPNATTGQDPHCPEDTSSIVQPVTAEQPGTSMPPGLAALDRTAAQPYPHRDRITQSFGRHDISGIRAQVGGVAAHATDALGADAVAYGDLVVFGSEPDLHTAAHEAAHVVQQRAGVSLPGGVGRDGDVYEQHADAVANAVVRGDSAEALLSQLPASGGGSRAAVQRKTKGSGDLVSQLHALESLKQPAARTLDGFKANARDYVVRWDGFIPALRSLLAPLPLPLPAYASWTITSNELVYRVVQQIVAFAGRDGLVRSLDLALKPQSLDLLVERYSTATSDQRKRELRRAKWRKTDEIAQLLPGKMDVAAGIAGALHAKLLEALGRMIPAYASARLHRYERAETEELPQAHADDLPQVHPMDYYLARALTGPELVAIDRARFVAAGGRAAIDRIDTKGLKVTPVPGMPGWYQASRADATPSEVAKVLLGSSIRASELCAAPPYFAPRAELSVDHARKAPDRQLARDVYARMNRINASYGLPPLALPDEKPAEPEQALLASDRADSIVLGQISGQAGEQKAAESGGLAPGQPGNARADKGAALRSLSRCKRQLQICRAMAERFGEAARLDRVIARIDERIATLPTMAAETAARWGAHADRQSALLFAATTGLQSAGAKLERGGKPVAMTELPPAVREPLSKLVIAYARAAAYSELLAIAAGYLAEARQLEATAAADSVDVLLTGGMEAQEQLRGVGGGLRSGADTLDAEALGSRRQTLRAEALALRAGLLTGDQKAAAKAQSLAERAEMVQVEGQLAMLVAKLDAVRDAAGAIAGLKVSAMASRADTDMETVARRTIELESGFRHILDRVALAKTMMAEAEFDDDRAAAQAVFRRACVAFTAYVQQNQVVAFFRKAAGQIEHAQTKMAIVDVLGLVVLTVASMGAGAVAGGVATGLRMSQAVQFVAATAAESVSFAALEGLAFGGDSDLTSVASDMAFSFAHFGLARAWGKKLAASKLGAAGAEGALGLAAKGVQLTGHGLIAASTMFAQMQFESGRKTGKFMGISEIKAAGLQGLGMMFAAAVAGRPIARLRGIAQAGSNKALLALKWRKAARQHAHAMLHSKTTNMDAVRALIEADRRALRAELDVYQDLAGNPTARKHASLTDKQLAGLTTNATQRLRQLDNLALMASLEPVSAHEVAVDVHRLDSVRDQFAKLGAEPTAIRLEGDTDVGYFWIKTPDGKPMRISGMRRILLAGDDHGTMHRHAQKITPIRGVLDVVVHGTVDWLVVKRGGKDVVIDHRSLAAWIKKSGGEYQRVRLIACDTGRHPKGVAQHLANKLGVEVMAPSDRAYMTEAGFLGIGRSVERNTGEWVTFHPKKSERRSKPFTGPDRPPHLQHDSKTAARAASVLAQIEVRTDAKGKNYEVTHAQGERMRLLFEKIEGVATIDYGHGFTVHHDGEDWYFRYVQKHEKKTPVASRGLNKLGLPEANVSVVTYHGFSGLKKVNGVPWKELPPAERTFVEAMFERFPLLHYGHVGISFDGGKSIFGFSPKGAASGDPKAREELLRQVRNHEPVPGQVQNDRKIFDVAAEMVRDHGWDTEITIKAKVHSAEQKHQARTKAVDLASRDDTGLRYQFPYRKPNEQGSHYPDDKTRNCATFPELLGLWVPERTGQLAEYMPKLKEAAAKSPTDSEGDQ